MSISPTAEGFRATFRRPALTLAEIAWRWSVGATAVLLLGFGLVEYLDTLSVTNGELLFLRTRHPFFVAQALAHIFRGSAGRAAAAGLVAVVLLTALWIVVSAMGRIATVRGLVDYFRERKKQLNSGVQENEAASETSAKSSYTTLVRLNFLRASAALAAIIGFVGAAIVAGFVSPDSNPRPGLAFLLFVPLAAMVWVAWWALNWILSLSSVFAVRDRADAAGSISAAVGFCRERAGAVFAVTAWTGLIHLVAFVAATTAASMPMGLFALVAWRLVVLVLILVTLAYFALVDWLSMVRLAGYVCIAELPEALLKPLPPAPATLPPLSPTLPSAPLDSSIDKNETILSDMPGLPAET